MKSKKVVVLIYLLLLITYISQVTVSAQSIKDISSSILKETEGKIIEYGLRYELTISEEPEKSCKEIFNLLSKKKEDLLVSNGTGGNKFSIEFHDEKSRAFIGYSQENKNHCRICGRRGLGNHGS